MGSIGPLSTPGSILDSGTQQLTQHSRGRPCRFSENRASLAHPSTDFRSFDSVGTASPRSIRRPTSVSIGPRPTPLSPLHGLLGQDPTPDPTLPGATLPFSDPTAVERALVNKNGRRTSPGVQKGGIPPRTRGLRRPAPLPGKKQNEQHWGFPRGHPP